MSEAVEKKLTVYDITVQAAIRSLTVQKNYLVVTEDLESAKREALELAAKDFPGTSAWVLGERREVAPA